MKHCVDSPAERRLDRIDAYNFEINQRIKKVEEEIKLVELEIIEAATIEDCYYQKQLMRLVNHKENKIESIKRNLING